MQTNVWQTMGMVPVRISVSMLKENMNKYNRKVLEQGLYLEFVKGGGLFFSSGGSAPVWVHEYSLKTKDFTDQEGAEPP